MAAVVLTWPADVRPQDESAKARPGTVSDDLKLVPADTSAFVTIRVADLMKSDVVKKLLSREGKEPRLNLAVVEKTIGMPVADVERLTVLVPVGRQELAVIVRTSRDYDPQRVLGPKVKRRVVGNHTVYDRPGTGGTVYLAGKRVLVVGSPRRVSEVLNARPKKAGPLNEALKQAAGKHHFIVGIQPGLYFMEESGANPFDDAPPPRPKEKGDKDGEEIAVRLPQPKRPPSLEEMLDKAPPALLPYRPLLQARSIAATADVSAGIDLKVELHYADEDTAQDGVAAARTALYVGRQLLSRLPQTFALTPEAARTIGDLFNRTQQTLKTARIDREKTTVRASLRLKVGDDLLASMATILQQQAAQQQVLNNLRHLGLASINFIDSNHGVLFGPAIYSKDAKPLLSWRVTLLPYLGEDVLYKQFKLDEPWDSPHNKKLLEKMPAVYAPVMGKSSKPYTTYLRVFTGLHTPFDPQKARRGPSGLGGARFPASFPDGTSNTILIVEAAEAVLWTKPDELVYDPKKPLPKLGGQFPGHFAVVMADTSVRLVRNMVSKETLQNAINPADGNPLGPDW
jgi:hypothetical protein